MKYKMPYDDYVMGETELNCSEQNIERGFGIYIWAYQERVLHELRILNKQIAKEKKK